MIEIKKIFNINKRRSARIKVFLSDTIRNRFVSEVYFKT